MINVPVRFKNPKALKTKVAEILLDSGLPELVPSEFGGTKDGKEG